jgi:glycerol-3-phosphate dehydrogenase (NAD(P)+)
MEKKITILGAGKWGRALAYAAFNSGCQVLLWNRSDDTHAELLPDGIDGQVKVNDGYIPLTTCVQKALHFAPICIIALAAQSIRSVISNLNLSEKIVLIASKGLEKNTGALLSEIVWEFFPCCALGILAGPNLSMEVEKGLSCGLTIASETPSVQMAVYQCFSHSMFMLEFCCDIIGIQVTSALKNVMAIGYGLLSQQTFSENFLASYLTLAFQEIKFFSDQLGGKDDTFLTYAGIGDFILSCTSKNGRNYRFGNTFPHANHSDLSEGAQTIHAVLERAKKFSLNLPILTAVQKILMQQCPVDHWPHIIKNIASQKLLSNLSTNCENNIAYPCF